MAIKDWSTTAGNNTSAPPNGAPEGWQPSSVNNVVRQNMADIRSWYETAQWIDYGHTPSKVDSDTFTVSGDQTATYEAGRRIKFTGSVSGYATISSSSYSAPNTTVNVTASSWTGTLTDVAVGIISATNNSLPYASSLTTSFGASGSAFSLSTDPMTVILGTADFQNGGTNYSISTGLFTAPVSGIYQFNAALNIGNGGGSANFSYFYFKKNSTAVSFLSSPSNSLPFSIATGKTVYFSGSVLLSLSAGDTVCVVAAGSTSSSLQASGVFSGVLMK